MAKAKIGKTAIAKELGVARSTLYYRPRKPGSDGELRQRIEAVMAEHPAYGHRRVALALGMNRKPVLRVMRKFGLRPAVRRRKRFVKPEDLGREDTRVPNVLAALCPTGPNVVWAGDFTYVWFVDRFWYVATVIDVFTREVVGWHVANRHTAALVMDAFGDAARRTGETPAWFHSDQGSEYVSGAYGRLLASYGTAASQSRKASPWQNGFQESFYSNFKLELGDVGRFDRVGELIEAVYRQIDYYNNRRIHSAVRMPPAKFRKKQRQKTAAQAAPTHSIYSSTLPVKSV
jgi:putative transposase